MDEKAAEKYLEALKKAAQSQTWDAEIKVNESLDFPGVYANLRENSDESGYDSYMPDSNAYFSGGSHSKESFLKNGGRLGSVRYFVPKVRVMTFDKKNEYTLKLRASGEVRLKIVMPAGSSGEKIPEEEYRAVFREIFENLGLSPETVDSFEFSHSSSLVW